ncbi:MAG: hypothetical protein AB1441_01305 [Bacillota bacterium]
MVKDDLDEMVNSKEVPEAGDQRFWPKPPIDLGECKAPFKVILLVFTNCLVINNGACPEWDFCDPLCIKK